MATRWQAEGDKRFLDKLACCPCQEFGVDLPDMAYVFFDNCVLLLLLLRAGSPVLQLCSD
jgi:hypothetical protein